MNHISTTTTVNNLEVLFSRRPGSSRSADSPRRSCRGVSATIANIPVDQPHVLRAPTTSAQHDHDARPPAGRLVRFIKLASRSWGPHGSSATQTGGNASEGGPA